MPSSEYKLPLDAVDAKGRTAFHIAASHGAENFIRSALESGMDVDAVNSSLMSKVKLVLNQSSLGI